MTKEQAIQFARDWYASIDAHVSPVALMRMAEENLIVSFPGKDLDLMQYMDWYTQDIRSNFNGHHEIHKAEASVCGSSAEVYMEITWTAETWTPPCAKSEHVKLFPNVTLRIIETCSGLKLEKYSVTDREEA